LFYHDYYYYYYSTTNVCVVVVLCASPDTVREIMIAAHQLHFDNGEYVFFDIDLFARLGGV